MCMLFVTSFPAVSSMSKILQRTYLYGQYTPFVPSCPGGCKENG